MVLVGKFEKESSTSSESIYTLVKDSYLPSIDGLRAISIGMVTGAHLGMAYKSYDHYLHPIANLGVQFFFVISGFLITTLLLKEKQRTGEISLKNFYVRRFFRIIPVAYLYLFVIIIINLLSNLKMSYQSILLSFLFMRNFAINAKGFNNLSSHYWSLSIEEQYYLLFPIILKKNIKYYVAFLIFMICFPIAINVYSLLCELLDLRYELNKYVSQFLSQFQAIAVGSLCSIILFKKKYEFNTKKSTFLTVFLSIVILTLVFLRNPIFTVNIMIISFSFASIIALNLQPSTSNCFQFLNNKYLKYIGVLSYSIYIWQQPFSYSLTFVKKMTIFQPFASNVLFNTIISIGSIIAIFITSCLSYFCFERRFLQLKNKFK